LGEIPILLYKIVNLKLKLESQETTIFEIIPTNICKRLSFEEAKTIINQLCETSTKPNLKDFLSDLFNKCNQEDNTVLKEITKTHISFDGFDFTFEGLISNLLVKLFQDESDDEKAQELINKIIYLLEIDFAEYKSWYNFINESSNNEVIYHTYHGTKGEEYDNVIILMENNFGLEQNKFLNFFLYYGKELPDEEAQMTFNKTKNLLYVACSRAIKNLRILYLDDTSVFQDGIKQIFGEVKEVNGLTQT
jgi:DNA helicase-2/ATP-dependent DNA helicase PcrA